MGETNDGVEIFTGQTSCYPLRTRDLVFDHSPVGRACITFHGGGEWSSPRGSSRCYTVDEDGALMNMSTDGGWLLRAGLGYPWDTGVVKDCELYAENFDDDPGLSKCMWTVRLNEFLLDTPIGSSRRGLPGLNNCSTPASGVWDGSNALLCQGTDLWSSRAKFPPSSCRARQCCGHLPWPVRCEGKTLGLASAMATPRFRPTIRRATARNRRSSRFRTTASPKST